METFMIFLSIIFWIIAFLFLLGVIGAVFEGDTKDLLLLMSLCGLFWYGGHIANENKKFIQQNHIVSKTEQKTKYIYKVRELEKNTVFNIVDTLGGFKPSDTVLVNYTTLMVDPLDSIAMKVIIIEQLKN